MFCNSHTISFGIINIIDAFNLSADIAMQKKIWDNLRLEIDTIYLERFFKSNLNLLLMFWCSGFINILTQNKWFVVCWWNGCWFLKSHIICAVNNIHVSFFNDEDFGQNICLYLVLFPFVSFRDWFDIQEETDVFQVQWLIRGIKRLMLSS